MEAEKENINLKNKIDTYIEKYKQKEIDFSILQTDFSLV